MKCVSYPYKFSITDKVPESLGTSLFLVSICGTLRRCCSSSRTLRAHLHSAIPVLKPCIIQPCSPALSRSLPHPPLTSWTSPCFWVQHERYHKQQYSPENITSETYTSTAYNAPYLRQTRFKDLYSAFRTRFNFMRALSHPLADLYNETPTVSPHLLPPHLSRISRYDISKNTSPTDLPYPRRPNHPFQYTNP